MGGGFAPITPPAQPQHDRRHRLPHEVVVAAVLVVHLQGQQGQGAVAHCNQGWLGRQDPCLFRNPPPPTTHHPENRGGGRGLPKKHDF